MPLLPSVIYVPDGPSAAAWIDMCTRHCIACGYTVVAIVRDWPDVVKMLMAGTAMIAVTGRRDMVPRERLPRLEVINEPEYYAPTPAQRRAQRIETPEGR